MKREGNDQESGSQIAKGVYRIGKKLRRDRAKISVSYQPVSHLDTAFEIG